MMIKHYTYTFHKWSPGVQLHGITWFVAICFSMCTGVYQWITDGVKFCIKMVTNLVFLNQGAKWSKASKAIALDAPTSLDALEISLLFCYTLTCNCLLKAMFPLKSAWKWVPVRFLILQPVLNMLSVSNYKVNFLRYEVSKMGLHFLDNM